MTGLDNDDDWAKTAANLGLNLRRARQTAGLSQEATAHAANLSVYTYRKLERGLTSPGQPTNPGLRTMVALAKVLGKGLDELVAPAGRD